MKDNNGNNMPAIERIIKDMSRLNLNYNSAYLSDFKRIKQAVEPIWCQHLEISRAIEASGFMSSHVTEIAGSNHHWQDMIGQISATSSHFEDFHQIHPSWLAQVKPVMEDAKKYQRQLQNAVSLSLNNLAYHATVAEQLYTRIDFEGIQRSIKLPESALLQFQDAIENMTATYDNLAVSIKGLQDLTYLPSFVLPGATREVIMTGYALKTIYNTEEPEEELDKPVVQFLAESKQEAPFCFDLLNSVDPALVIPYKGAHDAIHSKNADRIRHILVSLREFWSHLLRHLAPDEDVITWVPPGENTLLYEGRPTRKARVLYVCRNLYNEPLSGFIVQDTNALIKLLDVFNRIHELESGLNDVQLNALLLRSDLWLIYILKIYKEYE